MPDPSGLFGDSLAVGAPVEDDGGTVGVGFVYVYTAADLAGAVTPQSVLTTEASVSYYGDEGQGGLTVRAAPVDLDNDGSGDLVLSMPGYTAATSAGRVDVLLSSNL